MDILYQAKKYNELTSHLLEKFYDEKADQNLILSPFSVLMLLAIAADASNGETREEIIKVLTDNLSFDKAMELIRWLQSSFSLTGALSSCNAVCVHKSIEDYVMPDYPQHLQEALKGELFCSEDIVNDVNAWAEKNTNGLINKIADDTMQNMMACMINATAFIGKWTQHYSDFDIVEKEFHNSDGSTSMVEMIETSEQKYVENDFFTGFVKPYKDIGYSFMALLPKDEEMLFEMFLHRLSLSDLFVQGTEGQVFVTMPEFTYSFQEDITSFCKKIGIHTIFSNKADFSPLSSMRLNIDAIVHKARIEVNREGTKAAAVTMSALRSSPVFFDSKEVYLDRPFIYAIMHDETGLPVFAGIVNKL